jgi:hypothetical protein
MSQHNESRSVGSVGKQAGEVDSESFASPSGPILKLRLSEPEVKVEPTICEFCGLYITEVDQRCAALDEGVCRP